MELRKSRRVVFERGYDAHMMAIDGDLAPGLQDPGYLGYRSKTRRGGFDRRSAVEKNFFCYCLLPDWHFDAVNLPG